MDVNCIISAIFIESKSLKLNYLMNIWVILNATKIIKQLFMFLLVKAFQHVPTEWSNKPLQINSQPCCRGSNVQRDQKSNVISFIPTPSIPPLHQQFASLHLPSHLTGRCQAVSFKRHLVAVGVQLSFHMRLKCIMKSVRHQTKIRNAWEIYLYE